MRIRGARASRRRTPEFEAEALASVDSLYRTALRLTRMPADAEDLVQETYLKAFRAADTFEPGTNLRAWLFTILHNTARNRLRDRARDAVTIDSETVERAADAPSSRSPDTPETLLLRDKLAAADRQTVESHMLRCGPCRTRLESEQAVRDLVGARKRELHSTCAPASLHTRCSEAGHADEVRDSGRAVAGWRARLVPLAIAASLVLIVGAAFIYPLTASSSRVMAA